MTAATRPEQFGRTRPFACLALIVGLLWAHHMYGMQQGEIFPKLVLFLFLMGGMSLAGCVHPPAFYALTKWGGHLPTRYKVMGGMFALAGAALGLYVLITVY